MKATSVPWKARKKSCLDGGMKVEVSLGFDFSCPDAAEILKVVLVKEK